jgi:diguanylate cyclase (GGDEF)-like protein
MAALAVMNLARIANLLTHVIPQDYLSVQGSLVVMVLANTALQCGAIVAYVWMTASLVRGDLVVQASTDPLTGLLNRRGMEFAAKSVLSAAGGGQRTSVIAIDLDDFKQINDSFGHSCGDNTLVAVARSLQLGLRHSDFIGRMGGDEFLALLPNTSVAVAKEIAGKLHYAIRALEIVSADAVVRVSASLGCAEIEGPGGEWGHLLIECDRDLYQQKDKRYSDGGRRSGERMAGAQEDLQEKIPHAS